MHHIKDGKYVMRKNEEFFNIVIEKCNSVCIIIVKHESSWGIYKMYLLEADIRYFIEKL